MKTVFHLYLRRLGRFAHHLTLWAQLNKELRPLSELLEPRWPPGPRSVPVGLEGDLVVSGDFTQVPLQLCEQLLVALGLVQRHKRVHVGKLLPGDGLHKRQDQLKYNLTHIGRDRRGHNIAIQVIKLMHIMHRLTISSVELLSFMVQEPCQ